MKNNYFMDSHYVAVTRLNKVLNSRVGSGSKLLME